MKQKDIALILVIAIVSGVISISLSNLVINKEENRTAKVEVVKPISDEFKEPKQVYFNENSINPTQLVQIGDSTNTEPIKNPR